MVLWTRDSIFPQVALVCFLFRDYVLISIVDILSQKSLKVYLCFVYRQFQLQVSLSSFMIYSLFPWDGEYPFVWWPSWQIHLGLLYDKHMIGSGWWPLSTSKQKAFRSWWVCCSAYASRVELTWSICVSTDGFVCSLHQWTVNAFVYTYASLYFALICPLFYCYLSTLVSIHCPPNAPSTFISYEKINLCNL